MRGSIVTLWVWILKITSRCTEIQSNRSIIIRINKGIGFQYLASNPSRSCARLPPPPQVSKIQKFTVPPGNGALIFDQRFPRGPSWCWIRSRRAITWGRLCLCILYHRRLCWGATTSCHPWSPIELLSRCNVTMGRTLHRPSVLIRRPCSWPAQSTSARRETVMDHRANDVRRNINASLGPERCRTGRCQHSPSIIWCVHTYVG
jgi:hypothetical protein